MDYAKNKEGLDRYEGCWENDEMSGYGIAIYSKTKNSAAKCYSGHWFRNKHDGEGVMLWEDGRFVE